MEQNPYQPPQMPSEPGASSLRSLLLACGGYAIWTIPAAFIGLGLGSVPGAVDGTPTYWMLILPLAFATIGATLYWCERRYGH